jgi:hypothetical protein
MPPVRYFAIVGCTNAEEPTAEAALNVITGDPPGTDALDIPYYVSGADPYTPTHLISVFASVTSAMRSGIETAFSGVPGRYFWSAVRTQDYPDFQQIILDEFGLVRCPPPPL